MSGSLILMHLGSFVYVLGSFPSILANRNVLVFVPSLYYINYIFIISYELYYIIIP